MGSAKPEGDDLVDLYGSQIEEQMRIEAQRRIESSHDKDELERLRSLSLSGLIESNDADTIPALMARLGTVRETHWTDTEGPSSGRLGIFG